MREFSALLTQYNENNETEKVYQLLKIINNFAIPDISILSAVKIGKTIKHLRKSKDKDIAKIATKIFQYYDSLIRTTLGVKSQEESAQKEETQEEKQEEKLEEKQEENKEEKKEEIVIIEEPKETEAQKSDSNEDKMAIEATSDNQSKPPESQESSSSIIESSQ